MTDITDDIKSNYEFWERSPYFEPVINLIKDFIPNEEATVIDISAHCGWYLHVIQQHSKNVLAFEPILKLAERLQKDALYNPQIKVYNVGFSDKTSHMDLHLPYINDDANMMEATFLKVDEHCKIISNIQVEPLGSYVLNNVHLIKIERMIYMGEIIRELGNINIKGQVFDIELNEPTHLGAKREIHLQNNTFRLAVSESDFYKMSACVLLAKRQLEIIKGYNEVK